MEINPKKIKHLKTAVKPTIDYSYQKSVSFSQYQIYKQCPFRWKLSYIDKVPSYEPNLFAVFGNAIHTSLQHYLTVIFEKSGSVADEMDWGEFFKKEFIKEYEDFSRKHKDIHFSNAAEMREFYEDGIAILNYFKFHRSKYFGVRGWDLVGIEVPLTFPVNNTHKNLFMNGYLDIVMYNEKMNTLHIYDIKTSYGGWSPKVKKDITKVSQLILYKKYFSEQYQIPLDKIEIQYVIVKRKIYESDYPATKSRIQTFNPTAGKTTMKRLHNSIDDFINGCFNEDGTYKTDKVYLKQPSPENCKYCPFFANNAICSKRND